MSRGSTLVSIRLKGVPDNEAHGSVVLGLYGDKDVQVSWQNSRGLTIACASCKPSDVNFQAVRSGDVVISYGSELVPPK
jgi:hypothetical protein